MLRARLLKRSSPFAFPGIRPGFDPNHIAAKGIVKNKGFSGIASNGGFISLLSGGKATLSGTPVANINGGIGPNTVFTTDNDIATFAGQSTAAATSYTVAAIVQFNAINAGSSFNCIFSRNGTTGDMLYLTSAGGQVTVNVNGTDVNSTFVPTVGVPYFIAASIVAAKTVTFVIVNLQTGQVISQTVTTTSTPAAPSATISIGNPTTGNTFFLLTGGIAALMYAPTNMSLPAMLQWAKDPWAFWYPRTLDLSMMLGGGSSANAFTLAGAEGAFVISGQAATTAAARTMAGAEGSFSISGQAAAFSHGYKIAGAEGSFSISGQAATELRGIKLGGSEGSFSIGGQAATLTLTTSGHFTLAGDEGSFTIGGQAAALNRAAKIAGAAATFSISGQVTGMLRGIKLGGAEATFTISGQPATELRGIKMAGAEGSFSIGGGAAILSHGLHLAGAGATFTISGQSAKFPVALSMPAIEGSFTISGQGAVLTYTPAGGGGVVPSHSNPFFATPGPGMALP